MAKKALVLVLLLSACVRNETEVSWDEMRYSFSSASSGSALVYLSK